MSGKKMWFGTRGYECWVPTPAISPTYARGSYTSSAQLINGGNNRHDSKSGFNTYDLSWQQTKKRDDLRPISDFADGVFDPADGANLIYWIDPVAADKNVLAQGWAVPVIASEDGAPLATDANGVSQVSATSMPTNSYRYPARAALLKLTAASLTQKQYIPIPPGYSAWVGIHGDANCQNVVQVQPVNGVINAGAVVNPTVMTGFDGTLVNTEFPVASSSGIVLQIAAVGSPTAITIYGLIVQILKTGVVPLTGSFVSGQGHSGCQFNGKPSKTPYSVPLDMVGMTARLEETGMYL
jgi:hypothetical protein